MSLVEVLFSIFIILLGLLGVAALLPVGRLEIVEAGKQDRAAACGRAAAHDAQARGMFDPSVWRAGLATDQGSLKAGDLAAVVAGGNIPCAIGSLTYTAMTYGGIPWYADTYCIDPYYIAQQSTWVDETDRKVFNTPVGARPFPYLDANLATTYMSGAPRMLRVTLAAIPIALTTDPAVHQTVFDRIFTWSDDQLFVPPVDPTTNRPDPQGRPTRPPGAAVNQALASGGNYAWLMTVTPEKRSPDSFVPDATDSDNQDKGIAYYSLGVTQRYTANVVVFYKRDYAAPAAALDATRPAERVVGAVWQGGADFRLRVPQSDMESDAAADYLALRENDWLMLCGQETFNYGANSSGNPYHLQRSIFNWYRVIALGDVGTYTDSGINYYYRDVTLAGPDWTGTLSHAALFTGVIGVYTVPVTNR